MLSPRYLAGISDDIVRIYSQLEHDIVIDMARRLHKMKGVTDASVWQAGILKEIGGLQSDVQKYLAKYDKEAQKEIIALFEEALSKSDKADMRVFDAAKRSMSDRQRLIFEAIAEKQQSAGIVTGSKAAQEGVIKTFSNLSRLTMSIATTASSDFITQANAAFMQTVSGAFDYNSALKNAVKNLAQKGIHTVEYTDSGKRILRSIEGAVRSNILTGINQTASRRTLDNCQDLDCDLVEVSAHMGARPSHAAWQGKVYSLSGTSDKYPSFYAVCMPGEPDGIGGVNCRHSYYPYFEGMERMYNDGELDEMKEPTVEYNGKKITQYEAEQNLRALERGIRKHKLEVDALEATGLDATAERQRLGAWQAKARDYCKETGLRRDYSREYVGTASGRQPKGVKPKIQHIFKQSQPTNQSVVQKIADMNAKADTFYTARHNLFDFVAKAETTQTMTKLQTAKVVEGQNLAGKLYVKRELKDINKVLKAQGFDGKPTVLSKADFLKAIDDDTFIGQRTYTAPDKETLDGYIKMLRSGDFYVDCRTGGRAHGKGMYAAADYTKGKDLRRVIDEMAHYQTLGATMRGESYTMTETLTIDPSAKIIDEANIRDEFIYRFTQSLKQQGYTTRQIDDKIIAGGWGRRDVGVLASLMGYDVIRAVPSPYRSDYMVILNRTKLILLGGE